MLNEWKKFVEEQRSSVYEQLASAREKWESKVRIVETKLGAVDAKFDPGLVSLAELRWRRRVILWIWEWERRSGGQDGLITSPSPRSLSVYWNRPQQRRKRMGSSEARERSNPSSDRGESRVTAGSFGLLGERNFQNRLLFRLEGRIPIHQHGC